MTARPGSRPISEGRPTRPTIGRFVAGLVGLFALTSVTWMGLWAAVTTVLYDSPPVVVVSGSMAPALDVGDLVVVEPYHGQRIHTGTVVVFDEDGSGRSIIHRVVEVADDGTFTTRGDANPVADSTPLEIGQIDASGRYLLPRVGLPLVWAQQGRWLLVVLAMAGLALAAWLARFALLDAHDPWLAGVVSPSRPYLPLRERIAAGVAGARSGIAEVRLPLVLAGLVRRRVAEIAAVVLAIVLAHATVTAYAAFADVTGNGLNSLAAATLQPPTGPTVAPGGCVGADTIAFRSASSGSNTIADQIVLDRPAGVQTGDVMIAAVYLHTHDRTGTLIDPPAGWQQVRIDTDFTHVVQGVFWREATGSEPPSYTFANGTADLSRQVTGGIVAYSGVDTTTPIDVHGGLAEPSVSFSFDAPSVTSTVAGATLVTLFGEHDPGSLSTPAGMTQRFAVSVGTGELSQASLFADQVLGAPGATGTRTSTGTGNGTGVGQSVVLDPAGGVEAGNLSWTPSGSAFADGYLLQRYIGATLDDEHVITPASTATVVDFGGLDPGITYTYRLIATSGSWRSTAAVVSYTPASC